MSGVSEEVAGALRQPTWSELWLVLSYVICYITFIYQIYKNKYMNKKLRMQSAQKQLNVNMF